MNPMLTLFIVSTLSLLFGFIAGSIATRRTTMKTARHSMEHGFLLGVARATALNSEKR